VTIQEYNFIFNNTSNKEHGVILCKFDNSTPSSNDEEVGINTSKTYGSDIFHLINIDYSNPLKFQLTICKDNGTYFNSIEQRAIKKWLCRTDGYHWLQIDQNDLSEIRYKCIITFGEMVDIGGKNGGMRFNVQCNSPFPFSRETKKTYTCASGTLSFNFYCNSDFADGDKLLYPSIKITSNTTGTIQIKNNSTNETLIITNCTSGEVITISDDEIPTTSTNRAIIDNWNYNTIYFIDGTNSITITGNCTVEFTYSYSRRVGG
jgi:phage-related protein